MSVELSNGVVLPDIPSDVLAQYPYFLITHRVSTTSLSDNYNFFAFNDEKPLCVGVDLSGGSQPILVAYAGTSYTYNSKALKVYSNPDYGTSDTEWSGVTSYTMSRNGFVNFLGSDGVGTTRVVASNFDIYNAATYEGDSSGFGDMTFTPGTEVYFTATHKGPAGSSPDPQKFLGVSGLERLIANTRSLIDAVLPSGGTTGQYLRKKSDSDRDVEWVTLSGNDSSVNAVLYTAQTLTEEQKAQARANIGISETSKIPTFDLTEMGLPPVNYGSGEIVSVDTDAQSLFEALLDGPVKIKYQFYEDATSGQVVDSEVVVCANTFSEHDIAQATFITVTNEFFMNSLVVFSERITLGSTIASNGGSGNVPSAEGVGF